MKADLAQTSLPAAVIGATVLGFTMQDWASIAAILLIMLQVGYLLWKWRREWKARRG